MGKITNCEYYKEDILKISKKEKFVAVDKNTGKVCVCEGTFCEECLLDKSNNPLNIYCGIYFPIWLLQEHEEKPTINTYEQMFLKCLNPSFKYIARDKSGVVWCYETKPFKRECSWHINRGKILLFIDTDYNNIKFSFIKWEDENAWLISDLLKLEVKDKGND